MSLLSNAMESCTILDKRTTADGYGSYTTTWVEGASINAAIVLDNSVEALTAQAQGVKGLYTITTTKALNLQYRDVLRRERDGKIFRVTTDGDDMATPASAHLNMRVVRAEEWVLNGSLEPAPTPTPTPTQEVSGNG